MILPDTNGILELMHAEPSQAVLDWFAEHEAGDLYISTVTEAELRAGLAYLPEGQRRYRLQQAIDAMIEQDFNGRILPFDTTANRRGGHRQPVGIGPQSGELGSHPFGCRPAPRSPDRTAQARHPVHARAAGRRPN
jgi:hypothetical protein